MSTLNERFVMVPISLLEIPEFVRYFDSKAIGSIYRVLSSKVWRVPKNKLRKNSSKRIKQLSQLYENGYLVSMHNLADLSEAVGYDERSVRRELNMLEYLNLIKIYKEGREVFYIVGEVGLFGKSGANMGMLSEGFYLDLWRDFANLSNEYSPVVFEKFREDIKNLFKDGQICHDFLTNLSQIQSMDDLRKLEQHIVFGKKDSPLIEKVIDNKNNSSDSSNRNKVDSDLMRELRSEEDSLKAITKARKFLREESLTLSQVKMSLMQHVDLEYSAFSSNPMFAIRLKQALDKNDSSKDHMKLANLWIALREDVNGVPFANESKEFVKIAGIAKNLLKKYSFNQIIWTIKKVVLENKSDAEFMCNGMNTVEFFVKKHAKVYQDIRDQRLRINSTRANMEDSLEDSFDDDDFKPDENVGRMFSLVRSRGGKNG